MNSENLNKDFFESFIKENVDVCIKEKLEKYQIEISELKRKLLF